jgi:PAS domain S-box-containing protein
MLKRQFALSLPAVCTLSVLLWPPPVVALNPSLDVSQYAHTAWTFREGFFNGTVYAFAQADDGYLLLGTQTGVVRFDGVRASPLPLTPGQQLPSTAVGALLTARDGTLWVGTLDGLVSWRNGQLTQYPALGHHYVLALLEGRDGTVWAGGFGSPTGKLCAMRGESTNCYGDDGSLGAAVTSLYEDGDGSLWVGAATGLWRWKPGPPRRYPSERIPSFQGFAQGDHDTGVMVAIDSVSRIAGDKLVEYPLQGVPSPLTAAHLLRDRNGGLWIGTNAHGVVHSYEGKTSLFSHRDGLSSDRVIALFEDREGTIWVATPDGIDQFRESPIGSLSERDGLSSGTASSILAARDGSVWIGTADGLNRWNYGRTTIYRKRSDPGLPDDAIQSLFEDERGRIWVSGFRGVAVFEGGRFTTVPSVPAGTTHAIAGDNHGGLWLSLWLTSNDYGLVHLLKGRIIEQAPWKKLGGGPGSGLVPDADGGVWTGLLSGGIAYFRAGQIRNLPLSVDGPGDDGSGVRRVFDLSRDHEGTLWAATENGLIRIANGRMATLTTANGLPCNAVHWIIEDDLSSYWLYTRCGLLRVARTELDAWAADPKRTIQATTFDTADGIRPISILRGFRPSVTKSPDGRIWFLNGDKVSFIDPAHIVTNPLPPPVHIEQITADGKTYAARRGLRLPPLVHDLKIDYTAASLCAPEKIRFRFKLEGQDRYWREVVNEREVEYSNLAPDNYRFRVIASNNSGVWNDKGDVLDFSIAPAYYQTNWFKAACVVGFLALLWVAYRFRVRRLQREFKQLRNMIETVPAMAWTALPDGSNAFVNRRWAEYTGLSGEDTAGSGWTAAVHPEDLQPYREKWRESMDTGEPFESEARFRCAANGEYRWHLARGVPLRDGRGKIRRWYGILTDIEDHKRAEQERERLRQLESDLAHINRVSMMGELAASVAHEVNQPLTGIVSNGSACIRLLAGQSPNVEEALEALRDIVRDGKRAGELISGIRAMTKRAATPREQLDLNDVIREVLVLVKDEAKKKTVIIQTEFADDLAPVMGDRVQLQQVVLNLVMNAIEAMSNVNGRPRELMVRTRNVDGDQVQVTVEDSGVGLDPNTMSRIFEPFYTTKSSGMGMGLSICRSIVQNHGGRLWVTANDGPGTRFHFTLPQYHREERDARLMGV